MSTYYLEFSEEETVGSAHKFYEVVVDGTTVVITYGRIGTDGSASTQTLSTEAEAEKFAQKKISEKKRKGYVDAIKGQRKKRTSTRRTIVSQPSAVKDQAPILWRFSSGSPAYGIFVDETSCWVGNEDGIVYKLNHEADVMVQYRFAEGVKCIVGDGNWIYVGCDDGNVYDLSGKTPRLAYEISEHIDIYWLDIQSGLLAVSDAAGNLTTVNYEDEEQWAVKTAGDSAWMVRCDEVGRIFYGDSKGVSCYYGWESNTVVWHQPTGSVLFGWQIDNVVYAGTASRTIHSFDKSGNPKTLFKADGGVFSCAASPDGRYVFAGDSSSSLYCFNEKGERLWKLATDCGSAYSMQYLNEKLYIVTTDGSFACVDVSEQAIEQAKSGQTFTVRDIKAPASTIDIVTSTLLEAAPAGTTGVMLKCVREGGKLRVKVVSEGYHDWYVQFPHNLRKENQLYLVDSIEESAQGGFYRTLGNIYAL
ncbi:WGR domain-containing protein [Spirosoma sp. BT702]|uniref:WGR domain-containing protein n=1 Tax=Spirosoma profusum TaxID=2771354 RepID=A0A926XVB2_9BACT|nr:WGR domain-containing protein [Spirosoma profusum]MBD2701092.1 WGR domain-containing protein [Spirosoma profusum]